MTESTNVMEDCKLSKRIVLVNFGSIIVVGLVVLFLELLGSPTRRGFFCNDDSIKYPYRHNTVSEGALVFSVVLIPLFVMILTELCTYKWTSQNKIYLWRYLIPTWVHTSATVFGGYILGLGLTQIISGAGKFTIGRLRPHFLAVCAPDVHCNGPIIPTGYILNYTCTGEASQVEEGRLSFPSGHASLVFFACVYLTMYLQSSRKWAQYGFLRGVAQFMFILAAWWVSLTRVMDYWHHWSDVFAGAALGCIAAYISAKFLPGIDFTPRQADDEFLPLQRTNSVTQGASNIP